MGEVLLVEPFLGGSHGAWANGLVEHSAHRVRLVGLPDRFWRWRMRGGAVTLAAQIDDLLETGYQPDVILVSDMVDVAGLMGLLRGRLGSVPLAVYFHENQLLYPAGPSRRADAAPAWVNWTSMVAADVVVFNSDFHRRALLDALPALLSSAPDHDHLSVLPSVEERCRVLPVGVDSERLISASRSLTATGEPIHASDGARPVRVVWNQRWDHDKDPEGWLSAMVRCVDSGADLEIHLAGERGASPAQTYPWAFDALGPRLIDRGHLPRADYERLLLSSDVSVSVAQHEFFGISVVEAISAGAVPLLPDRLSHPELVDGWNEVVLYADGDLDRRLSEVVDDLGAAQARVSGLRDSMLRFDWASVIGGYDRLLAELI